MPGIPLDARPDRSGVVLDMTERSDLLEDGYAIVAREAFPGGLEEASALLDGLAEKVVVLVLEGEKTRTVRGPAHKVEPIREKLRRALSDRLEVSLEVSVSPASKGRT